MHNLGNCEGVFVEKFNIKYNNKYDIIFIKKKKNILKLVINTYRDNTSFFYSIKTGLSQHSLLSWSPSSSI